MKNITQKCFVMIILFCGLAILEPLAQGATITVQSKTPARNTATKGILKSPPHRTTSKQPAGGRPKPKVPVRGSSVKPVLKPAAARVVEDPRIADMEQEIARLERNLNSAKESAHKAWQQQPEAAPKADPRIALLTTDLAAAQEQIKQKNLEIKTLNAEFGKELEKQKIAMEKDLLQEKALLQEQLDSLRNPTIAQETVVQLGQELEQTRTELLEKTKILDAQESITESSHSTITELQEKATTANNEIDRLKKQLTELREQSTQSQKDEVARLNAIIKTKEEEVKQAQEGTRTIHENLTAAKTKLEKDRDTLNKELAVLKETNKQSSHDLAEKRTKITQLEAALITEKDEKEAMASKSSDDACKQEVAQLRKENEQLNTSKKGLESMINDSKHAENILKQKLASLEETILPNERILQTRDQKITDLTAELDRKALFEKENLELKSQIRALTDEKAKSALKTEHLTETNLLLEDDKKALEKAAKEKIKEMVEIETKLAKIAPKIKRVMELENTVEAQKETIQRLEKNIDTQKEKIKKFEKEIDASRKDIADEVVAQEEIRELRENLESNTKELEKELENQIEANVVLHKEISKIREENNVLQMNKPGAQASNTIQKTIKKLKDAVTQLKKIEAEKGLFAAITKEKDIENKRAEITEIAKALVEE